MGVIAFKKTNTVHYLFYLLLVVSILPVWVLPFFITADGPCHVYNAHILSQWLHNGGNYYREFFYSYTGLFPNWCSHIFLLAAMQLVSPLVAEKLLITACLVLLATGFRYYINSFAAKQTYLALWVFPFLWQMSMLMGFYNYMLSIGLYFLIAGYWQNYKKDITWRRVLFLSLLFTLLFFMHLIGLLLAIATIGLFALQEIVESKPSFQKMLQKMVKLFLITGPALILTCIYIIGKAQTDDLGKDPVNELWTNLTTLSTISNMTDFELWLAKATVYIITLFAAVAFIKGIKQFRTNKAWLVPFLLLGAILFQYLFGYSSMLGGSFISYRLESLLYLFAIIFVAAVPMYGMLRKLSVFFATLVSLAIVGNRLHSFKEANNVMAEIKSLSPYIKDRSVILPVKYDNFPKGSDSKRIAKNVLLFSHMWEVMDLNKELVFLENYEASTYYFPLVWKERVNPYIHLSADAGFEEAPPEGDLAAYNKKNAPVNYIILWGDKIAADTTNPEGLLSKQIDDNYGLVYTTPVYHIKLYALKPLTKG